MDIAAAGSGLGLPKLASMPTLSGLTKLVNMPTLLGFSKSANIYSDFSPDCEVGENTNFIQALQIIGEHDECFKMLREASGKLPVQVTSWFIFGPHWGQALPGRCYGECAVTMDSLLCPDDVEANEEGTLCYGPPSTARVRI